MEFLTVEIEKPEDVNVILGQAHFIKAIDDVCEASGPCLVRRAGNDEELTALAVKNASAIGAGHAFVVFLREGFPVNVLNQLKQVPEVCRIYCATANQVEVIVVQTELGRGIAGVVDGASPLGVETEADVVARHDLLRKIGYKL
jgi:adenosine/AMP kinase